MKIATNLSLAVQMLAFSEGVLLAEKSGIKRRGGGRTGQQCDRLPMVKYRDHSFCRCRTKPGSIAA
jgi:hypothetical protein